MHSVTLGSSGSPRKRTLSRGLSEDESLRSIIKETESSSRRLTRSDSRTGTLKKRNDSQHSDQDLFMGLPDMLDLQANYDEVVQELRGLEFEREALLFQVDVLQDTLESVEELLAEAQREAGQASLELEQERGAKRKLESMVCSLMQEVERLKEEKNNAPAPVHVVGRDKHSSQCEPHSSESSVKMSEEVGQREQLEDEGNIIMKLRRMVSKPLGHTPSLALDNQPSEDGILCRPFENGLDSPDPSPDSNDFDNISAYEDASAETPEQDRIFPGYGETLELPDDSENKEKSPPSNCQVQDNRNPESCTVS